MADSQLTIVTVSIEDRSDGGINVSSSDLKGLILSGADRQLVCRWIAPAIKGLLEAKGMIVLSVKEVRSLSEVLQKPSPRDVEIHVIHQSFAVEFEEAA